MDGLTREDGDVKMRKLRTIPMAALAALALVGCEGASRSQGGDPDAQGAGQAEERGQGTIANDTAPYRPGAPTPNTTSDANEDNSNESEKKGEGFDQR